MFGPRRYILLFVSYVALGQSFSIGIKGGGLVTKDIYGSYPYTSSESKRYVVGPTLELGLTHSFSLEVDALYRRVGYQTSFDGAGLGGFSDRERANSWEIPVLLKFQRSASAWRPYAAGGFAPRTMNGYIDRNSFALIKVNPNQFSYSTEHLSTDWPPSVGVVLGGGVQLRFGGWTLSPEVRYTHWLSAPIDIGLSYGYGLQSAQNQVDILMGVSWRVH